MAGALLMLAGFMLGLRVLRVATVGGALTRAAAKVLGASQDPALDDDEREKILRRGARDLARPMLSFGVRMAACLLVPVAIAQGLDLAHVASFGQTWHGATTGRTAAVAGAVSTLAVCVSWWRSRTSGAPASSYSSAERALHQLAFGTVSTQLQLAEMETRTCRARLAGLRIERPVFVAGLPRSGSTLLLELLENTGIFASQRYSDMPFVFTPWWWNVSASPFRHGTERRERAHGDGMLISPESPEAFEEMLWKPFWPSRYKSDHIKLWQSRRFPEFDTFFEAHVKKVIMTRKRERANASRYLSKNNLNIARLRYLQDMFPDAIFLVPFRDPLQQALSLLRQHLRFVDLHAKDEFAREYMLATGHFDFGANLKPVDFDNWWTKAEVRPLPQHVAFWLEYWCRGYAFLSRQELPNATFVSYEALCADPASVLRALAEVLDIPKLEPDRTIQLGPSHPSPAGVPQELLGEARELAERLARRALH